MYDKIKFAERVKYVRCANKKTQKEFADSIGSTTSTVSAYEKGGKNPTLEIISNIATQYNVSLDWLCGLTDRNSFSDSIKNYSDIINFLFALKNSSVKFSLTGNDDTVNTIVFDNIYISNFLEEWEKMSALYQKQIIDKELYDFWIEKVMSKYDLKIK